jgi:hypothetical protein
MRIIKSTPAASHCSVVSVDSIESTSKCLPGSTADIPQSVPAAVIAVSTTQLPLDSVSPSSTSYKIYIFCSKKLILNNN